jgi:formiminotetrahydrofolate cyclodeaminase
MGKSTKEAPQLVGKSLKMPKKWDEELTKLRGAEMQSTGQEVSATTLILRALDQAYKLAEKTGVKHEDNA